MACDLPVMRKDFLLLPSELIESRAAGADAVLLIAACLSAHELTAMLATARDLGLGAVVDMLTLEPAQAARPSAAAVMSAVDLMWLTWPTP